MPKRTDIHKILVIGSGPIVIGQAAEFDYAGTQACLALREEGYDADKLAAVHTPIGLKIGAETPAEIAVSICAELVQHRRSHPAEEDDAVLEKIVRAVFDMTPAGIIKQLKLKTPKGWSYRQTAAYGHFGRNIFPWEKTDKVDALIDEARKYCDCECDCSCEDEHCECSHETKSKSSKKAAKKTAGKGKKK